MKITSRREVKIQPRESFVVPVNQDLSNVVLSDVTLSVENAEIKGIGFTSITILNKSDEEIAIVGDGVVATVGQLYTEDAEEEKIYVGTSETEEAFAEEEDGTLVCPLCGKEYKSEGWLRNHMEDEHDTVV